MNLTIYIQIKLVYLTSDRDTKLISDVCGIYRLKNYFNDVYIIYNILCISHRLSLTFELLENEQFLSDIFVFIH